MSKRGKSKIQKVKPIDNLAILLNMLEISEEGRNRFGIEIPKNYEIFGTFYKKKFMKNGREYKPTFKDPPCSYCKNFRLDEDLEIHCEKGKKPYPSSCNEIKIKVREN